jgi:pimeloyl-ACP methyl ester carboxylesterase
LAASILEGEMPNASKRLVDGSRHLVNLEKPEEFHRAVIEYLD